MLDLYLKTYPGTRKVNVLDMYATDDPTHGKRHLSFFHGYYEEQMYHPLLVFDGHDGFPLAAMLRPGNTCAAKGALAVLKRLIKKLKKASPGVLIIFRLPRGVIFRLPVRWAKPAISCRCKSRPAKAVAGRLGASLAGVMVTWGPKRRQRSSGVWD